MTEVKVTTKVTSELRVGDIVLLHGMMLRISNPTSFPAGHVAQAMTGEALGWNFEGLVLNPDDVTDTFIRTHMFWHGASSEKSTVAKWAVQGNDLVRWEVLEGV